jgi:protein gp37
MSAALANPAIVKITTVFKSKLADIDLALFASADTKIIDALNAARDDMFGQIRSSGSARYEVGISVSKYHAFYKQLSEKAWRDQVGPIVIDALGYKSLKSLYNLMADADLAHQLGAPRREALVALGIDPASRKYAELVRALLPAPPSESTQDTRGAVTVAHARFRDDRNQQAERQQRLAVDPQEFKRKVADQLFGTIVSFTKHAQGQDPIAILTEIAEQVQAQLVDGVATSRSAGINNTKVLKSNSGLMSVATVSEGRPANSGGTQEIPVDRPMLVRPKALAKPFRVSGPAHPWGDACLNSLRVVSAESGIEQKVEFDRARLYQILNDPSPKRFLVDDSPDLFELESDDVIREHLSVFGSSRWHLFLLLTNNLERANRIKLAMNASGVDWPFNVWLGTSIECREDIPKIKSLAELGLDRIWISFADYRSNRKRPLAGSALTVMLKGCRPRWIIGRADLEGLGPEFSVTDAIHLKNVAWSSGLDIAIFFAQPRTKAAFVRGEDISKPVTREPNMIELLKTRIFPEGFELQRPTKWEPSGPSKREPVEIIGYLSSQALNR